MLTRTNPPPKKDCLKLVTPRVSVSVIEISIEEAKELFNLGVSKNVLKKYKKLISENIVRSEPIFNLDCMKLYTNEVPVFRDREILKKSYEVALKNHAEYAGEPTDWYSQIDYSDNNLDHFSFSIVFDRYYEQSEYQCEIDDEYESSKIGCQVQELYLEKGKEYLSCYWAYEKRWFQISSEGLLTKEDCYLFTTSSRRFNLNFI
jgi:hypothetical protein